MANDQGKGGQQGGTTQNNPGNFANDREKASEAGQKGGQTSRGDFANDPQRANEAGRQGGKGGHSSGTKSDNGRQDDMDKGSQATQDEDSGMTDDNR
ncbi:general stress protein [Pseudomonas putida]|uniref:general stress protein n=1 Tax=Pseudomonas putida TaxID=303 RepID=UPI00300EF6BC